MGLTSDGKIQKLFFILKINCLCVEKSEYTKAHLYAVPNVVQLSLSLPNKYICDTPQHGFVSCKILQQPYYSHRCG